MLELFLAAAALLTLILVNGYFSATEMAVLTARKAKLAQMAQDGDKGANLAMAMAKEPERFLSGVQIGVTLATVLIGAFGQAAFARPLATVLGRVAVLAPYAQVLGTGLVVGGVTCLGLVLGELAPKRLALAAPEAAASALARPMVLILGLVSPAAKALAWGTRLVLAPFRLRPEPGSMVGLEEIKILLKDAALAGVLAEAERDMLERVLRLGDKPVASLMIHRSRIVSLDLEDSQDTLKEKIMAKTYNRFPVTKGGPGHVQGFVEAKDLLAAVLAGRGLCLEDCLTQPLFVLESTPALRLLDLMRRLGQHLAVVVDEFGDVQGLVSLREVVEAVVGDLAPGLPEEPGVTRGEDGTWLMDGLTPADEAFGTLGLPVPEGDFQTMAGFMLLKLGRIPAVGEGFSWQGYDFTVQDMDGLRIKKVLAGKIPNMPEKP